MIDPKLVPSGKIIEIFGFGYPSTLQTFFGFHLLTIFRILIGRDCQPINIDF